MNYLTPKKNGVLYLNVRTSAFLLAVMAVVVGSFSFNHALTKASRLTCDKDAIHDNYVHLFPNAQASLTRQGEAQAIYDTDRLKYHSLDLDKDGVACEALLRKK